MDDTKRYIAVIIVSAIFTLYFIANSAIRLAERIIDSNKPMVPISQPISTPKVSLPNPNQYYFIACTDSEIGIIIDKAGNMYRYICEKGEWKGSSRL